MNVRRKSKKRIEQSQKAKRETEKNKLEKAYFQGKKEWDGTRFYPFSECRSLEEFVEDGLKEFDVQLKLPSGKYRDFLKVTSDYQQRFVVYMQQHCPQVFEELREFTPLFGNLFGNRKYDYIFFLTESNMLCSILTLH